MFFDVLFLLCQLFYKPLFCSPITCFFVVYMASINPLQLPLCVCMPVECFDKVPLNLCFWTFFRPLIPAKIRRKKLGHTSRRWIDMVTFLTNFPYIFFIFFDITSCSVSNFRFKYLRNRLAIFRRLRCDNG